MTRFPEPVRPVPGLPWQDIELPHTCSHLTVQRFADGGVLARSGMAGPDHHYEVVGHAARRVAARLAGRPAAPLGDDPWDVPDEVLVAATALGVARGVEPTPWAHDTIAPDTASFARLVAEVAR